ncbi:MAG: chemotaxis protein CheW [Gammaproteobacteria bacterium]
MASGEDIYSLLIPLESDRLVVPRSCVAEVVRYAEPSDQPEDDGWFRGTVKWNNHQIPVISIERMAGMPPPEPAGKTRIVVFQPVSAGLTPYGLLAEGFPQMLRVSREVIELDQAYNPDAGTAIICRVQLLQEQALIPDLEQIEQQLIAHSA